MTIVIMVVMMVVIMIMIAIVVVVSSPRSVVVIISGVVVTPVFSPSLVVRRCHRITSEFTVSPMVSPEFLTVG